MTSGWYDIFQEGTIRKFMGMLVELRVERRTKRHEVGVFIFSCLSGIVPDRQ